jgi:signal transduction histidine kinase
MVVMAVEITRHRALEAELMEAKAGLEHRVRERTAELERAVSELQAFTYRVSHDLQGPLRAMRGLVGEVAAEARPCAPAGLERIAQSVDRMSSLIGALLDLSHAGRRAVALERVPIGLGVVAAEAAAEVGPAAEARGVRIEIAPLPECECDPRLMRLALVNLLANAVKFSRPGGGRVSVRAVSAADGGPVLEVADDDVGFDAREAESLFTPFERLSNARGVEGAGVGLAIVQRIVAAHGGTVSATGAPGAGACIRLELPRRQG